MKIYQAMFWLPNFHMEISFYFNNIPKRSTLRTQLERLEEGEYTERIKNNLIEMLQDGEYRLFEHDMVDNFAD